MAVEDRLDGQRGRLGRVAAAVGAIVVTDATAFKSSSLKKWKDLIDRLNPVPTVLVTNKCGLVDQELNNARTSQISTAWVHTPSARSVLLFSSRLHWLAIWMVSSWSGVPLSSCIITSAFT